jgi:hypothetical protein
MGASAWSEFNKTEWTLTVHDADAENPELNRTDETFVTNPSVHPDNSAAAMDGGRAIGVRLRFGLDSVVGETKQRAASELRAS